MNCSTQGKPPTFFVLTVTDHYSEFVNICMLLRPSLTNVSDRINTLICQQNLSVCEDTICYSSDLYIIHLLIPLGVMKLVIAICRSYFVTRNIDNEFDLK